MSTINSNCGLGPSSYLGLILGIVSKNNRIKESIERDARYRHDPILKSSL